MRVTIRGLSAQASGPLTPGSVKSRSTEAAELVGKITP